MVKYISNMYAITLCALAFTVTEVCCQTCTRDAVEDCLNPLLDVEKSFDEGEIFDEVIPYFNRPQMKQICEQFKTMRTCLEPITPNCTFFEKKRYDGYIAAYEYICEETLEEYFGHQPCLNKSDLHIEAKVCYNTFNLSLREIKKDFSTREGILHYAKKLCLHVNIYLDCIFETVRSYCGKKAAHWKRILDERALKPEICEFGCSFIESDRLKCRGYPMYAYGVKDDPVGLDTTTIIAGVCVAALIILLIVVIVVFYFHTKHVKEAKNNVSSGTVVVYNADDKTVIPPVHHPKQKRPKSNRKSQGAGGIENPNFGDGSNSPDPETGSHANENGSDYTNLQRDSEGVFVNSADEHDPYTQFGDNAVVSRNTDPEHPIPEYM